MNFGKLLTKFREAANFSKTDLARALKVSLTYVINLEKGKLKPSTPDRLKQIAQILSLSSKETTEFFQAAAEERIPPEEKALLSQQSFKTISISDVKIPIVSRVGATDQKGRSEFEHFEPPYITIDFANCKALVVDSNSMAPLAYRGQKIIYCEDAPIHNGDLVFVKLKNGDQLFKRYHKEKKNSMISLLSLNIADSYEPILVEEADIKFCYKVVGVRF